MTTLKFGVHNLLFRQAKGLSRPFHRQNSGLTTCDFGKGVQDITLNSPKTRNSLSLQMMKQLRSDLKSNISNPELRCIVLRSTGSVFSAGHNLKELTMENGHQKHLDVFNECNQLMMDIVRLPVPVIAAVDGLAAAAGCQLVAICDIAIATKDSSFSTPGSSFGLYCSTPGVPLARSVPRKVSSYMLLTGNAISAEEALRSGLISRMTAQEDFENEIQSTCEAIKSKPRAVVELGKTFYYKQLDMGLSKALDEGGKVMVDNLSYCDAQEGLAAFKEKRKPIWKNTDERV